ncbi:MAG: hypothetical protein P1U58_20275 [Verrucomicrobiales bacterium]|nr:hypothetical protein [Verrucomicrobiales bacterium]
MNPLALVKIRAAEIAEKITKLESQGVVVDPIETLKMLRDEFPFQGEREVGQALASAFKEIARQRDQHTAELRRYAGEEDAAARD